MRVIKLVADRQRERRRARRERPEPLAGRGPLAREKGWVPLRYWAMWFFGLGVAVVLFYVILTPIWLGLRAAAWVAEFKARRLSWPRAGTRRPPPVCGGVRPGSGRARAGSGGGAGAGTEGDRGTKHQGLRGRPAAHSTLPFQSSSRPRSRRTVRRDEPGQPDAHRKVEPDDDIRAARARDRRSCAGSSPSITQPSPARIGLEEAAQLVVRRLRPVRPVDERVELDERHAEPPCELATDRRLAAAARRGDDGDLPHRSRRVGIGSAPPSTTR